jgi:hypothetical protein
MVSTDARDFSRRVMARNSFLLLTGILLALAPGGCSDADSPNSTPDPAIDGCLDYNQYSIYSEAPMAGMADWFNGAQAVATQGDRAYVAGGRYGLQIFDISDRSAPVLLSSLPFPSIARALEVSVLGDYAYVLDFDTDEGALRVIDISNSASPRIVQTLPVPGGYQGLDIVWPCVYVARGGLGLAVFDISRPAQTRQMGQIELSGMVEDVAVDNGYAFCLVRGGVLEVVDVHDPRDLNIISSQAPDYVNSWARGIDVAGGLAVTSGDSMRIIDVSSPRSPDFVASIGVRGRDVVLLDHRAMVINEDDMVLTEVDVSDPTDPVVSAVLDLPRGPAFESASRSSLTTDGSYAYLAVTGYGFQIADVSTPGDPVLLAQYATMGPTYDVAYLNGYAYVACGPHGLEVFEVDDPASPQLVGWIKEPSPLYSIVEEGGWIYAVGGGELFVFDLSQPTVPPVSGRIDLEARGAILDVEGSLACVTRSFYTLALIDVSNRAEPALVGEVSLPGEPVSACLSKGFAYLATEGAGLVVVDVDPPDEAAIVAVVETTDEATAVTVDGDRLYLAAGELHAFDVADPATPILLGVSSSRFFDTEDLLVADGLVYAKSRYRIRVCDIADPTLLIGKTVLEHGGYSRSPGGLALAPDTVLIAKGGNSVLKLAGLGFMWRNCGDGSIQSSTALTGP